MSSRAREKLQKLTPEQRGRVLRVAAKMKAMADEKRRSGTAQLPLTTTSPKDSGSSSD